MNKILNSNEVIDSLIAAVCGEDARATEKHALKETLRALVRLAKSEQMLELKASLNKLSGGAMVTTALFSAHESSCTEQIQH